jgi:hypothetical protein
MEEIRDVVAEILDREYFNITVERSLGEAPLGHDVLLIEELVHNGLNRYFGGRSADELNDDEREYFKIMLWVEYKSSIKNGLC